jgi:16S rRNA processing protein RimM
MVVVGRIQGPYGIQGWVHVASFTDPSENIQRYSPWQLSRSAGNSGWQPAEVEQIRPHKQGFVAKLTGVSDRNAAEAMKGLLIGVPESSLPPPAEDEYYWRELIGARVLNADGGSLGRVRDLIETGAHDVLVVASNVDEPAEESTEERLIPFHANYVLAVDAEAGVIRVDWSEPDARNEPESD